MWIADLASKGYNGRIHKNFPVIEAEILYSVDHEDARTVVDVISRRTRMTFLDAQSANEAIIPLVELMGGRLGWSADKKKEELAAAISFVNTMNH